MRSSRLADVVLFTMFGVIMFISDIGFEFLPNIHGVALSIAVVTLLIVSSLPRIYAISVAPPGVDILPESAVLNGHRTTPFLTPSCATWFISVW